jgi:hypothetical protein
MTLQTLRATRLLELLAVVLSAYSMVAAATDSCGPLLKESAKYHLVAGDGKSGTRNLLITQLVAETNPLERLQAVEPLTLSSLQLLEATEQPPINEGVRIVELQMTTSSVVQASQNEVVRIDPLVSDSPLWPGPDQGVVPWPHQTNEDPIPWPALEDETIRGVTACHLPVILMPAGSSDQEAFAIALTAFAAAKQCGSPEVRLVVDSHLPAVSAAEQAHLALVQWLAASLNHVDELRLHVANPEAQTEVMNAIMSLHERLPQLSSFAEAYKVVSQR